jgi:hypothetical protein
LLKKSITFKNFNDETVTKDFYFHLSKPQILAMNLEHKGGLQAYITALAEAEDSHTILKVLTEMITMSVGRKSPDGNTFLDSQEIKDEFLKSPAFGELLMEMATDETGMQAAAFINGIAPSGLAEDVDKMSKLEDVKAKVEARKGVMPKTVDESSITRDIVDVQTERVMRHPEADPTAVDAPLIREDGNALTRKLTQAEVQEMDINELKHGLATGKYEL